MTFELPGGRRSSRAPPVERCGMKLLFDENLSTKLDEALSVDWGKPDLAYHDVEFTT